MFSDAYNHFPTVHVLDRDSKKDMQEERDKDIFWKGYELYKGLNRPINKIKGLKLIEEAKQQGDSLADMFIKILNFSQSKNNDEKENNALETALESLMEEKSSQNDARERALLLEWLGTLCSNKSKTPSI